MSRFHPMNQNTSSKLRLFHKMFQQQKWKKHRRLNSKRWPRWQFPTEGTLFTQHILCEHEELNYLQTFAVFSFICPKKQSFFDTKESCVVQRTLWWVSNARWANALTRKGFRPFFVALPLPVHQNCLGRIHQWKQQQEQHSSKTEEQALFLRNVSASCLEIQVTNNWHRFVHMHTIFDNVLLMAFSGYVVGDLSSMKRNTAVTRELKHEAQASANGQFSVSFCPKYSLAAQFTTPINIKNAENKKKGLLRL